MNIKQLTTKLQEEGREMMNKGFFGEEEITARQIQDRIVKNTINQTLAYVSEEVEGMKHLSVHTHNVGRCRVCIRNDALTDIQKILEVKE